MSLWPSGAAALARDQRPLVRSLSVAQRMRRAEEGPELVAEHPLVGQHDARGPSGPRRSFWPR